MTNRTVIIAGASGLVGQEVLNGLLSDDSVSTVYGIGRRPVALQHPKLRSLVVDFTALPALPEAQELYLALGTTIKVAGSQQAFRAVDYDANLAVARAALAADVRRVGLVSAMGADTGSRIFYSRVKGELEAALAQMPFDTLVIARPSLLSGDRTRLGQPERPGEKAGFMLSRLIGFLVPANYRPIAASAVARALLTAVPSAQGKVVLLSSAMQRTR